MTCTVEGCDRPHKARGMCSHHYNQAYYAANPEKHRDRARRWYHQNPDRAAANRRQRDATAMRRYSRDYYAANRLRYIAHAANQKARRLGVVGLLTAQGIAERFAYFGWRCWICHNEGADSVDHVKPLNHGGPNLHSNIRPAHLSCNSARTWEARRRAHH